MRSCVNRLAQCLAPNQCLTYGTKHPNDKACRVWNYTILTNKERQWEKPPWSNSVHVPEGQGFEAKSVWLQGLGSVPIPRVRGIVSRVSGILHVRHALHGPSAVEAWSMSGSVHGTWAGSEIQQQASALLGDWWAESALPHGPGDFWSPLTLNPSQLNSLFSLFKFFFLSFCLCWFYLVEEGSECSQRILLLKLGSRCSSYYPLYLFAYLKYFRIFLKKMLSPQIEHFSDFVNVIQGPSNWLLSLWCYDCSCTCFLVYLCENFSRARASSAFLILLNHFPRQMHHFGLLAAVWEFSCLHNCHMIKP